jgi:hypothetical protein
MRFEFRLYTKIAKPAKEVLPKEIGPLALSAAFVLQ